MHFISYSSFLRLAFHFKNLFVNNNYLHNNMKSARLSWQEKEKSIVAVVHLRPHILLRKMFALTNSTYLKFLPLVSKYPIYRASGFFCDVCEKLHDCFWKRQYKNLFHDTWILKHFPILRVTCICIFFAYYFYFSLSKKKKKTNKTVAYFINMLLL